MALTSSDRSVASRRAVLARALGGLGLLATTGMVGGCDVRLEDDAPDLPFIPRRVKVSGESQLLGLLGDTRALAARASGVAGDETAQQLAALHTTQAQVLHDRLQAAGVPIAALAKVPSPTSAPGTAADLREAESAAVADAAVYAGVDPAFATIVLAMMAQRRAATLALAAVAAAPDVATSPSASPSPSATPSASASSTPSPSAPSASAGADPEAQTQPTSMISAQVLTALDQTFYLLDVIEPHAADPERELTLKTRAALTILADGARSQLRGNEPPAVFGIPHPADLDNAQAQRAAIAAVLTRVITAYGNGLPTLAKTRAREAMGTVPQELGGLVDWARLWGLALTPFPGLS